VKRQGEEQRKRYRIRNVALAVSVLSAMLATSTYLGHPEQ
jgi:hypothetical protein